MSLPLAYQRPTLLIFTHSSHTLLLFRRLFEKEYHIIECDSVDFLQQILETAKINLIFLQETSIEEPIQVICRLIRNLIPTPKIPILIITRQLKHSYMKMVREAGASGFILEPLDEKDILAKMKSVDAEGALKEKTSSLVSKIPSTQSSDPKEISKKVTSHIAPVKETHYNALALQIDNFGTISHMTDVSSLSYFLDEFAASIKSELRPQDTIKETEKGKYLVTFPKTSKRAAMILAEGIKETLDKLKITTKSGVQPITVTIAFASESYLDPKYSESNLTKMIELSKKRLEQAKEQGDRIIYY
jgi:response regulator RpfG family c-di-GMP phosphodiesterase